MRRFLRRSFALLALAATSGCGGGSSPMIRDYRSTPLPRQITPQSLCYNQNGRWVCSGGSETPCDISSQTYATSPINRTRTILGVEEQVALTTTTGQGWSISSDNGSTLSGPSGNSATLTAGNAAGTATVTVSAPNLCTPNELTFQVVAPSSVLFVATNTRHIQGYADVGTVANVYLGPDTVSFENLWWDEALAYASGSGVWLCQDGQPHEENQNAFKVGSNVVPGYGSELAGGVQDLEDSGACGGNQLQGGSESVTIPEQWQTYGSAWNLIGNMTQSGSADATGTATLTKDPQATETAHLNDPNEGGETPP